MLESADVEHGGLKQWINRKPGDPLKDKKAVWTRKHTAGSAADQQAPGLPVTADKNWIFIDPETIQ